MIAEGADGADGRSPYIGRQNYKKMIAGTENQADVCTKSITYALGMTKHERYEIGRVLHLGSGSAYQKHYISYQGAKWDPFVNGNEIPTMNENKQNRTGMQMGIKTKLLLVFYENRTNCNEEFLLRVESWQDGRGG